VELVAAILVKTRAQSTQNEARCHRKSRVQDKRETAQNHQKGQPRMELLILIAIVFLIYLWINRNDSSTRLPTNSDLSKNTNKTGSIQISAGAPNAVYEDSQPKLRQEKKDTTLSIINAAIENGKMLKFEYTDPEGEITNRTVTPITLERRHNRQIYCLNAYCHLRKDARTFVVWRMKRLTLV